MEKNIDDVFTKASKQGFHERVSVLSVRPNPCNFYRDADDDEFQEEILNTAEDQKHTPQMQDLIGYYDEGDDGKSVTLLSGEKRWRAALINYENGDGGEYLDFLLIPKPQSQEEEYVKIIQFNNHSDFSKDIRAKSAKILWDIIEKTEPELSFTQKTKKIAVKLNKTDRTVRNYLASYHITSQGDASLLEQNVDAQEEQNMEEDLLKKQEVEERLQMVSKEIAEQLATNTKLKQTKKKGYVLSFNLENSDDLLSLLSILGCENVNLNGLD